jgi:hypothetical protein
MHETALLRNGQPVKKNAGTNIQGLLREVTE